MIDYTEKFRARKAAKEYIRGNQVRIDANELSPLSLAGKFAVSEYAIKRAIAHTPVSSLTDREAALVRQCHGEHQKLLRVSERLSKACLAVQYRTTQNAINIELELMGYAGPRKVRPRGYVGGAA